MLCASSGMFNRDIFEIYGDFDERLIQLQDFDLWLKIIANEDTYTENNYLSAFTIVEDAPKILVVQDEDEQA